jgi:L-histidine Nalpha-methyltransferase
MPKLSVFVSHITEERALAEILKERLQKNFLRWVQVFSSSDGESISAGDEWLESIRRGLTDADILLVLCSPTSIRRPWINFEAGAAWISQKRLIPVCHSGLTPGDLPMPLSVLHGISAASPDGLAALYHEIAKQLQCDVPALDFEEFSREIASVEQGFKLSHFSQRPVGGNGSAHGPIEKAIDEAGLGWTLCFIGEDQSDKLAAVTDDLKRGFSSTGDGKQFDSGTAYWGIGPALAWVRACNDPLYLVMKRGTESFPERWTKIAAQLQSPFHYVSLGVGTGVKDRRILKDLSRTRSDLYYFPVDMSPEMLRIGIKEPLGSGDLPRSHLLPIQIDFSIEDNVAELRRMLHQIVGDEAILYSLLGNTVANFQHDTQLLETVAALLRPHDRLLLEVASTLKADLTSAKRAADEYANSTAFKQFVTSALLQYTDLPAGIETVSFIGLPEEERAILVKAIYRNDTGRPMPMKLPDNTTIEFLPDDTIRLLVSRKYTGSGLSDMLASAGLECVSRALTAQARPGFGIELVLAATGRGAGGVEMQK